MLDICYSCSSDLDIIFNPKKSCLFCIGKHYGAVLPNLRLCNTDVFWCNKLKYLGLTFVSGKKLVVDISPVLRKFYTAANAIFSCSKYVSDIAKLHLFESFTLPLMSLTQHQLAKLNASVRIIFIGEFLDITDGNLLNKFSFIARDLTFFVQ